jgi:hypothetical protein
MDRKLIPIVALIALLVHNLNFLSCFVYCSQEPQKLLTTIVQQSKRIQGYKGTISVANEAAELLQNATCTNYTSLISQLFVIIILCIILL